MGGGECVDLQVKKRVVSTRTARRMIVTDGGEYAHAPGEFVGLLYRPICRSIGKLMLAVAAVYHDHDPRCLLQKDDVHPEAQRDAGERVDTR